MKNVILLIILFLVLKHATPGQTTIALTFTALFEGCHKPLGVVHVKNLTRGGEEFLSGGDTVLILQEQIGAPGLPTVSKGFHLQQNYPNPFSDQTTLILFMQQEDVVIIHVSDRLGREHLRYTSILPQGQHHFTFHPGSEQYYFLTAETRTDRRTIRMIHIGSNNRTRCNLEYMGHHTLSINVQKQKLAGMPWAPGDTLRITGYALLSPGIPGHDIIDDNPSQSKLYIFNMVHGLPCIDYPAMTDHDGNVYRTIRIGNQCWMRENLRATTTFFAIGNLIPLVTSAGAWTSTTSAARCWNNNDSATYAATYGSLYNYYAAKLPLLCPAGWKVPSHEDFDTLVNRLGGSSVAGGKMKESGTTHWTAPNADATNESGFTALPGGSRSPSNGSFGLPGNWGSYWTSAEYSTSNAWFSLLGFSTGALTVTHDSKQYGYSVRCMRNLTPVASFTANDLTPYVMDTVLFTDLSSENPTAWKWDFGDGATSTNQHPYHVYQEPGKYTVGLVVTNQYGSDTLVASNYISTRKIYDFDGNAYDGVRIGSQYWLRQNLRATHTTTGIYIPLVASASSWLSTNYAAHCWYSSDSTMYAAIHGALYNRKAVSEYHDKICPAGWHVASDSDWVVLAGYFGGDSLAGGALKSSGTQYWSPPNTGATNISGFNALPSGYRHYQTGNYEKMLERACIWTSTAIFPFDARYIELYFDSTRLERIDTPYDRYGFSIRCVRN